MDNYFNVNDIEYKWREKLNIKILFEEVKDNRDIIKATGHGLIVSVNGQLLGVYDKYDYVVQKNDDIKLIQMVGGG